jgi:hypothetical protein
MKYAVIGADNLVDLENKVNGYLSMGWIPQGGILGVLSMYYQAVVIEEPKHFFSRG